MRLVVLLVIFTHISIVLFQVDFSLRKCHRDIRIANWSSRSKRNNRARMTPSVFLTGSGCYSIHLVVLGRDHHLRRYQRDGNNREWVYVPFYMSESNEETRDSTKWGEGTGTETEPGRELWGERHAWSSYLDEVAWHRWGEVGARTAGQRTARNTDTTLLSGP